MDGVQDFSGAGSGLLYPPPNRAPPTSHADMFTADDVLKTSFCDAEAGGSSIQTDLFQPPSVSDFDNPDSPDSLKCEDGDDMYSASSSQNYILDSPPRPPVTSSYSGEELPAKSNFLPSQPPAQIKTGYDPPPVNKGDKRISCEICSKDFIKPSALKRHNDRVHLTVKPFSCDLCEKSFTLRSELGRHIRVHTGEKPYVCDTCGKSFSDGANLSAHRKIHGIMHPYSCTICRKPFQTSTDMERHTARTHRGEQPYVCQHCNKTFWYEAGLKSHLKTHTGEKPYPCDECGKSFTEAGSLRVHKRLHTNHKPFKCDTCEKSFTDKSNFTRHKRTHTGEKPYTCRECGMSFSQNRTLKAHATVHTGIKPFKCDKCDKHFAINDLLKMHQKIHSEDGYPCDICKKNFSHPGNVSAHKRLVHNATMPYPCIFCRKLFKQKNSLIRHLRSHKGDPKLLNLKTENPEMYEASEFMDLGHMLSVEVTEDGSKADTDDLEADNIKEDEEEDIDDELIESKVAIEDLDVELKNEVKEEHHNQT